MHAPEKKFLQAKFFSPSLGLGFLCLLFSCFDAFGQSESVIYNAGSGTLTIPHRVTSIQVQAWGGGASGGVHTNATGTNADARGGGGGGAYATNIFTGTNLAALSISWSVGAGGIISTSPLTAQPGANGGNSTYNFNGTGVVVAGGGNIVDRDKGGTGGVWTGIPGTTGRNGGNGSDRLGNGIQGGGGGGSGPTSANATGQTGGAGSGAGGNGGATSGVGQPGNAPGGGGGGKGGSNTGDQTKSGNGAPGRIQISWSCSTSLSSTAGSNNQNLCLGTGIGAITYVISGATGATVSGLPPGLTANYSNGDLTISGVPSSTGIFNYTVIPSTYCTGTTATGTITVNGSPSISSQATAGQSICVGGSFSPISVSASGAGLGYQWYSNSSASNTGGTLIPGATDSSFTPPVTAPGITLYYYAMVSGTCSSSVTAAVSGAFVVNDQKTVGSSSSSPTLCIDSTLSSLITHITTNATGIGSATGLPSGVSATYNQATQTISISGTPSQSGIFNYSIPILGCGPTTSASGTITVLSNTVSPDTPTSQSICLNSAIIPITYTTTGATGISNNGVSGANGLPSGVSASWASNKLTISGTPTQSGVFTYSIPLTGGCGTVNATGILTVNAHPILLTPNLPAQTQCINQTFSALSVGTGQGWTYQWFSTSAPSTSGGTPIVGATNSSYLPPSNVAGTLYYYVVISSPTSCGAIVSAVSGAQTVLPTNTAATPSSSPTLCVNTPLSPITILTTGATGIGVASGLPAGVTAAWASNTITLSGTPTATGTFNYTIPLTGGCGTVNATGSLTVLPSLGVSGPSSVNPSVCFNTAILPITHSTTGATGIGPASGLPAGLTASWSSNTITISGTPTSSGTFNYSIPLTGGCGNVAATGTITVSPGYSFSSISSIRPQTTGNTASITVNGPSLSPGTYTVTYNLSAPNQAIGQTANLSVVSSGTGLFNTIPIINPGPTTLTITGIKKSTEACTIPISQNHITSVSLMYLQFDSSTTFTIPQGVTCVRVELWGGGGAGGESDGSKGGGGGGGGAYLQRVGYAVSPGSTYTITIGGGGNAAGVNGGATTFASGVGLTVAGGLGGSKNSGGAGGSIVGSPSFIFDEAGGNGGFPTRTNNSGAAGGGQAGGIIGYGINGSPNLGISGGAGGGATGSASSGGAGGAFNSGNGLNGISPGGGGGGAGGNRGKNAGLGASGRVIIYFDEPCVIQTCSRIIDDGSISGNVVIEFFEDCVWNAPQGLAEFEVLAIGGGGGGGSHSGGGGGSGGIVRSNIDISSLPGYSYGLSQSIPFEIKIGVGGAGSRLADQKGSDGGTTIFNSKGTLFPAAGGIYRISAGGGGGGGTDSGGGGNASGKGNLGLISSTSNEGNMTSSIIHGSGGGASHSNNPGGNGLNKNGGNGSTHSGGGGGGANSSGASGTTTEKGGAGGNGIQFNQFDNKRLRFFSGGGGGGSDSTFIALGGSNVGGNGGYNGPGQSGKTPGSGGGGGGHSGDESGGNGASGIVFVKYEILKILPIEFLSFEAIYQKDGREGQLFWSTAKEWENSHFEVNRSINDIQSWETIGKIEGAGYSEKPTSYFYFDKNLPASGGTIFYRLKQVDFAGGASFSVTRAIRVEAIAGVGSWIIYPNPTNGTHIKLELLESELVDDNGVIASLSNALGQVDNFQSPDLGQLSQKLGNFLQSKAAGIYVLTLNWSGKTESYRIIKN